MLTYSEYKQIYSGNLSLLEFNSLKLAVQTVWKHNIKENYIELANTQKVKDIDNQIQGITKKAYWKLISKLARTDGAKICWEADLGVQISTEEWEKYRMNVFKITNSDVLRIFQYKLLERALVTNILRCK